MSENEERYGATAKLFVYAVVLYEADKEPRILRLFLRQGPAEKHRDWLSTNGFDNCVLKVERVEVY